MKKLDLLVLKSILGPFLATLLIGNFVLLMQFLYRKLDDLVGKGLEWYTILELLMHASSTLVPLTLPLAVLISSIMAMGNLSERYELVAAKSSGVSLLRILRPLIVASFIIAGIAFFFANTVMPYSRLKLSSQFYNISLKKPALLLKEGIFLRDFDDLVMKVGRKTKDNRLYDVLIYDHRKVGQSRIIRSDSAKLVNSDTTSYMLMHLMNGKLYEEKDLRNQMTRFGFDEMDVVIDMTSFKMPDTNEDLFKGSPKLKNIKELDYSIDSLERRLEANTRGVRKDISDDMLLQLKYIDSAKLEPVGSKPVKVTRFADKELYDQKSAMANAGNRIRTIQQNLQLVKSDNELQFKKLVDHKIAWYEKFALAFSCVVLFFIGAPLGALVKKGGLGLPIVLSVGMYFIYHMINLIGRNLAESFVLSPMMGIWFSTLILFPFALYLTHIANTDQSSKLLSSFITFVKQIGKRKAKSKENSGSLN